MKIAVIGASAGVGLELVRLLLERGHQVTTLSRRIDTLPEHPAITRFQGSALNVDLVSRAIRDADVILVTLGTGSSTRATGLYPGAANALLQALQPATSQPTLIVLTGFGAGDSWRYNSWPMRLLFRLFLKDIYAEKTRMEEILAQGYPKAMFVRPGRLTDGPQSCQYRVLLGLGRNTRVGSISRGNVAHFLAWQAEHPAFLGRYPALSE